MIYIWLSVTVASIICNYLIVKAIRNRNIRPIVGFTPQNEAEREALREIPGVPTVVNARLVRERNISIEKVKIIKGLHYKRHALRIVMEMAGNKELLCHLKEEYEKLEYDLQDAWGFPRDNRYHEWFKVPQCSCPWRDNQELIGTENRIINAECPVHGE